MKFFYPIQVRFRDLDALNHVNNAVYFSYVEIARVAYFDNVVGKRDNWHEFTILLVRNEINYRFPINLKDKLKCGMKIASVGTTSFQMEFQFIVEDANGNEIIVADGKNTLVCYDNLKKEKAPVPEEWKLNVSSFEGISF